MMLTTMKIYTIKDVVTGEYGYVFEQSNNLAAERATKQLLKSEENQEDFELYVIGELNHLTGEITPIDKFKIDWLHEEVI